MRNRKISIVKVINVMIFIILVGISGTIGLKYAKNIAINEKFYNSRNEQVYTGEKIKGKDINDEFVLREQGDMIYISPFEEHFRISGFSHLEVNSNVFYRLDEEEADSYPLGVKLRGNATAGGKISFKTNSSVIDIKVVLDKLEAYPYFTLAATAGIDVYRGNGAEKEWIATGSPNNRLEKSYSTQIEIEEGGMQEITINMPLYSSVKRIEIGLERDAIVDYPSPYTYTKPIVFYGSSITQGCSASRPGNSYPNLVTKWLDSDLINLGFSSSAKGENQVAEYISNLEMSALVMEYDHNADTVQDLEKTHYNFYSTIRQKNPSLPIIFLSRVSGGISISEKEAQTRRNIIEATYNKALENGDKNVYYLNGGEIIPKDIRDDALVDGKHPNDIGMYMIAKAIYKCLMEIFDIEAPI